jgi:hypothetical protein
MSHIRDRGKSAPKRWQARYVGPDGKEHTQTFGRKIDAENWLTAHDHKQNTGEWVDPELGKVRFETHAEEWLATKANVRPRTLINIEGRLKNHIGAKLDKRELRSIRTSDVRALVASLSASKPRPGQSRASSSH